MVNVPGIGEVTVSQIALAFAKLFLWAQASPSKTHCCIAPMWAAIACASLATSFYGLVAVDSSNKRLLQSYPIALVLMLTLDVVWVVTWTAYIGENYTPVKGQWGIPAFRDAQKALLTCEWFALGTRVLSIPFWLKIFITAKDIAEAPGGGLEYEGLGGGFA
ncbi:hypothetical protein PPROV_000153600 [Pycnococcus provasolii]|uniref:MARVEL domain-containing protein n=1 Tax=Pycnococcus provasolii TaxID=41880 RepID=A0A830HB14_9CHLO|nr:hypothetical protein PPROV_000153600 [Pycnococcus provasolii]